MWYKLFKKRKKRGPFVPRDHVLNDAAKAKHFAKDFYEKFFFYHFSF